MPVYTNPIVDQEPSPKVVYYVDNKCALFTCNGSPEGVILANTGSIALSDNGSVFKKTTDDLTTGWIELTGGTVSSPFVISGTNPTLSFVDTDIGDDDASISVQSDLMTIGIVGGTPIVLNAFGNILNIPRNIQSRNDVVGNVGAGLDSLHSHSLIAASLASDNDFVACHYSGRIVNNANTKRLVFSIDGQISFDSGARQFNINNLFWDAHIEYTRLSATTVSATGFVQMGVLLSSAGVLDTGNSRFYTQAINPATITVANLNTNAVTILVQGEATANDDITQNRSRIDLIQK